MENSVAVICILNVFTGYNYFWPVKRSDSNLFKITIKLSSEIAFANKCYTNIKDMLIESLKQL